jgi:hypothetical protein
VKQTYERALFNRLNDRPQEAQPLYLSPEAEQHRQEFFNAIEPRLKNDLYFMSDWAGKLAGAVCRIAGILHCFSCPDPAAVQISGETMMNAIKLGFCFLQHAQAAYGAMGSDQTAAAAKYVLKRLNGVQSITKRNLHQLCRGRFKKVDELEPIITALIDHGYLRESTPPSEGAGRKPSPTYSVNPLLSQNTHNAQNVDCGSEGRRKRPRAKFPHRSHNAHNTQNKAAPQIQGADVKSVQSALGHYSAAFTLDTYVHSTEQMQQRNAQRMQQFAESLINKKTPNPKKD